MTSTDAAGLHRGDERSDPAGGAESAVLGTPSHRTYLMCRPEHFTIGYRGDPWMNPQRRIDTARALAEWRTLYDVYLRLGHDVELIEPVPGMPEMVFTAGAGFVLGGVVYPARSGGEHRAPEEAAYERWFAAAGFEAVVPRGVNEGERDALVVGERILVAAGAGGSGLADAVGRGREVVRLGLTGAGRRRLETALAVLDPGGVVAAGAGVSGAGASSTGRSGPVIAYDPAAFDEESRATLAALYPDALLVGEHDAGALGLNTVSDGYNVVLAGPAAGFERRLRERGYNPIVLDLSELARGGGGAGSCTLELRR